MSIDGSNRLMDASKRIGLWFVSLILTVTVFSMLFSLLVSTSVSMPTVIAIFQVAIRFALPVWCLYLPFVVALKDAEGPRLKTLLLSGSLIGPASVVVGCFILLLRGANMISIVQGDPLTGLGAISVAFLAFIIGFMTTCLYVIALKGLHRTLSH
jgi:hypothetical protein